MGSDQVNNAFWLNLRDFFFAEETKTKSSRSLDQPTCAEETNMSFLSRVYGMTGVASFSKKEKMSKNHIFMKNFKVSFRII